MIFHWINSIARWFRWMFWPPEPQQEIVPVIPLDAPCPWCGHRNSKIRAVPAVANMAGSRAKVERICQICSGISEEKPVIEGGGRQIDHPIAAPELK